MCKTTYTRVNNPYESITAQYRTNFQTEKNLGVYDDMTNLKQMCVKRAVAKKKTDHYDMDSFRRDTAIRVQLLCESRAFQKWCQDHSLDTYAAATNVVMLGITTLRGILCDNIISRQGILLDYYSDWNQPLFTSEELGIQPEQTKEQTDTAA